MGLKLVSAVILAPAAAMVAVSSDAATSTGSMSVTATVPAICTNTVTPMTFGPYANVVLDSTATVTVTCSNTTPFTVALSAGAGTGPVATVTSRHMMNGTAVLNYSLSQNAGHSTNWGNTPGTDTPVSQASTGVAIPLTVYGEVAAGQQLVTPGSFTDTIVVTVTY